MLGLIVALCNTFEVLGVVGIVLAFYGLVRIGAR